MSEYYKLLKDPRWQKKRLEIMENAGFACEECGNEEETLHAHHLYYEKNTAPWDYPDHAFECLCETCHKRIHSLMDELKIQLRTYSANAYEQIVGYAVGRNHWLFENMDFHPPDRGIAEGFADYYKIDRDVLVKFLKKHGKINYKQVVKLKKNG